MGLVGRDTMKLKRLGVGGDCQGRFLLKYKYLGNSR